MKKIIASCSIALMLVSCSITSPVAVTNNTVGAKEGKSETVCVFGTGFGNSSGLVLNKKYGVSDAAKNGNIKTIGSVDVKIQNFIIFQKYTLIVTGE